MFIIKTGGGGGNILGGGGEWPGGIDRGWNALIPINYEYISRAFLAL